MKAMGVGVGRLQVARDRGGRGPSSGAPSVRAARRRASAWPTSGGIGRWRAHDDPHRIASPRPSPWRCDAVIPVVTPEEMAAVDAAAPEPVEVLIERAGAAVARRRRSTCSAAAYGRRVVGAGRQGQQRRRRARRPPPACGAAGVRVEVIDAADAPDRAARRATW